MEAVLDPNQAVKAQAGDSVEPIVSPPIDQGPRYANVSTPCREGPDPRLLDKPKPENQKRHPEAKRDRLGDAETDEERQ
jgi:hypothetical protein